MLKNRKTERNRQLQVVSFFFYTTIANSAEQSQDIALTISKGALGSTQCEGRRSQSEQIVICREEVEICREKPDFCREENEI